MGVITTLDLPEHLLCISPVHSSSFVLYGAVSGYLVFPYWHVLSETRHDLQLILDA